MKENKKTLIYSVLGLVFLIVIMIGVTYSAFNYTKKGEKVNVIRTGKLSMTYKESDTNIINIDNASPISDELGKELTGKDKMFTFEVSAENMEIGDNEVIYYEITAEKLTEGEYISTLDNQYVRMYLEKSPTGNESANDYVEVLPPTSYTPMEEDDTLGASKGEMLLYFDSFSNSDKATKYYKLRMWVGEDYALSDESKTFAVRVNVYASDTAVNKTSSITLNKTTTTLVKGTTETLTATINSGAKNRKLIWASSDISVATVTENGVVTAVAPGNANITVRALDEADETDTTETCQVTVIGPPANGITITETTANLIVGGDTETLHAIVTPEDYANSGSITWESSDPSVATVSNSGVVTPLKAGSTEITASILGYTSNKCVVIVQSPSPNSVTITPGSSSIEKGQSIKLSASVAPTYATSTDVTWSVDESSTSLATVDQNGNVTATGIGEATIWATSKVDETIKQSATITITKVTITDISLSGGANLKTGATHIFSGTFKDKNGNEISSDEAWDIIWSDSLDSGVVSGLDECRGKISCAVTGEKAGTANITVTAYDSSNQPSASAVATSSLTFTDYKLTDYVTDLARSAGGGTIITEANVTESTTLFQDATVDKNIRYTGPDASVNNYVNFNCDSDGTNCEKWRIIGVFNNIYSDGDTSTGEVTGTGETRIKLMRATYIGSFSRNVPNNPKWEDSDLMKLLNGGYENFTGVRSELTNNSLYWNNEDGFCYNGNWSEENTQYAIECNFKSDNTGLKTEDTKNMISTSYWHLGAYGDYWSSEVISTQDYLHSTFYSSYERGITPGKASGSLLGWIGKVAIIYPTDYLYAGYFCNNGRPLGRDETDNITNCNSSNWTSEIFSNSAWFLSPTRDRNPMFLENPGYLREWFTYSQRRISPTIYLNSSVVVRKDGADGSENKPYNIQLGS